MAADAKAIHDAVATLAQRLGCELQTYQPNQSPKSRPGPQRHIFPSGPYALGLWHPGDDVHLVCLTDNSSSIFWEYVAEKLVREDLPKYDCIISEPGAEANIWLRYCSIPPSFDLATVAVYGFPEFPDAARRPSYIVQNLAKLQDTWHLLDCLHVDIDIFRDAYRLLRSWAGAAGILSQPFGMLDSEALMWMLFKAETESSSTSTHHRPPFPEGVPWFVERYKDRNSLRQIVTPNGRKVYAPLPHLEQAPTIIAEEIGRLGDAPGTIERSCKEHYQAFCRRYMTLMLVTAECWEPKKRVDFHNQLLHGISKVLERLSQTHLKNGMIRIWPQPLKSSHYEWVYVIGVEPSLTGPWLPKTGTVELVGSLEIDVDNSVGRVATKACSSKVALDLLVQHSFGNTTQSEDAGDTEQSNLSLTESSSATSSKFPPASHVLSRLRWDPAHTAHDYEVGYLDRFEGLMWLPLEKWGKAIEEEDFVPEHRIRVFRRVGKGGVREIVWERESRLCRL